MNPAYLILVILVCAAAYAIVRKRKRKDEPQTPAPIFAPVEPVNPPVLVVDPPPVDPAPPVLVVPAPEPAPAPAPEPPRRISPVPILVGTPPDSPPTGTPSKPAPRDPFAGPFTGPVHIGTLSEDEKFAVIAASHMPGCGSLPYLFLTASFVDIQRLINYVMSDNPSDPRASNYYLYTGLHRARLDRMIAAGARGELRLA